jgi:predicted ATP-grasp superfamily ATP-dependent carboligase
VKPAIVISTYTMGLGVIRALGRMGVPVIAMYYDHRDMGYVSRYVREAIRVPHPAECEQQFIDLLVDQAEHCQHGLLMPTSDAALVAVSRHKACLEQHYIVGCTEWEITEQFIDKKCTYALGEAIGVPVPKTIVPRSVEQVEQYGATTEFPCLVKPCQSHLFYAKFKQKMIEVHNLDQMLAVFQQAAQSGLDVVLQEFIPGSDTLGVNYNSYFWDGEAVVEFTAEKVRNAPPRFGSPRVAISKEVPEVIAPGRKILQAMGFYGFSCTEFKKDPRDGVYKLMEVNGRHNLSSMLAVRCGVNFPWLHYKHLTQNETPSPMRFQQGVYWIDIIRDLRYSITHHQHEQQTLTQYIRPYLKRHVFAVLSLRDPRPFFKRLADLVRGKGIQ